MVTRTKKIFVGGLSASTVQADLTSYFSQFGKVEEAMLMFDRQTNRHRGFGFVTFDSEDAVEKVCEIHYHEINNKTVSISQYSYLTRYYISPSKPYYLDIKYRFLNLRHTLFCLRYEKISIISTHFTDIV